VKVWIEDTNEIREILNRAPVGRLGVIADDEPYIVPLNFAYAGDRIYFHTGLEGRKLAALSTGRPVCFEVDELLEVVPNEQACLFTAYYRSVIITGTARLLEDDKDKMRALELLLEKYAADASYEPPPEHALAIVNVCEITPTKITTKANLPDTEPG
jgi:nitroimidazol reductase NimA-like FMN-containing flavoprotein (pyridoxamine 5'-phosphate oxidase superfamily)